LLIRHGGHAAAAGFSVRNENLEALKKQLKSIASKQLGGRDLRQTLIADAEVPLSDLHSELLRHLNALQPTGYGNPEAVFVTRNARVSQARVVGSDGIHLKLVVTDGHVTFDAIGFRLGRLQAELPIERDRKVDLIYTFESNEFNGRKSLQLNLKDVKAAGVPD
jgi:single-stranded-DNA-specific exonuclease